MSKAKYSFAKIPCCRALCHRYYWIRVLTPFWSCHGLLFAQDLHDPSRRNRTCGKIPARKERFCCIWKLGNQRRIRQAHRPEHKVLEIPFSYFFSSKTPRTCYCLIWKEGFHNLHHGTKSSNPIRAGTCNYSQIDMFGYLRIGSKHRSVEYLSLVIFLRVMGWALHFVVFRRSILQASWVRWIIKTPLHQEEREGGLNRKLGVN